MYLKSLQTLYLFDSNEERLPKLRIKFGLQFQISA